MGMSTRGMQRAQGVAVEIEEAEQRLRVEVEGVEQSAGGEVGEAEQKAVVKAGEVEHSKSLRGGAECWSRIRRGAAENWSRRGGAGKSSNSTRLWEFTYLPLPHCQEVPNTESLRRSPDDLHKFIKDNSLEASDNLTNPMKLELYQLLFAKCKAFVSADNLNLGQCDIAEISIRLRPDVRPEYQKHRLSPNIQEKRLRAPA
ncbi:hypothetical protein PoB_004252300 [Plakobranchus ocellatus]|uniref:Uncharacterized protein n=1 Tax=Plakobranchus ocellatus TaxID=259542 RepID=A0AAV4BB24_9GAST|nr:hypothetical protein PoB_004252300 [Plakobranchus ocellatus]